MSLSFLLDILMRQPLDPQTCSLILRRYTLYPYRGKLVRPYTLLGREIVFGRKNVSSTFLFFFHLSGTFELELHVLCLEHRGGKHKGDNCFRKRVSTETAEWNFEYPVQLSVWREIERN